MKKLLNSIPWKTALSFYATIAIPLLYLCNLYVSYRFSHTFPETLPLLVLGILLALVGISLWMLSYYFLGFSFGVLPQKQKRVTKGLYAYFSHPMYVGIWLTFVGLSLANGSLQGLLFLTLIITPLLFIRATLEERKLFD